MSRTQRTLFVCCLVLLEISVAAVAHGGASGSNGNGSSLVGASSLSELKRLLMEQQVTLLTLQSAVLQLQSQAKPDTSTSGGATYIRWGRTSCPGKVELVYKGYAGGSHYNHTGAAVNYLCLPEDPQYGSYTRPQTGQINYVHGAEYETMNRLPTFYNFEEDVPCAVCRIPTRSTVLMIPAKTSCHPGYHREYFGYLMAGLYHHNAASEFVCVDVHPEKLPGGSSNQNGKLFYFVEGKCGSLPCPPYVEGRELTCVVCSK